MSTDKRPIRRCLLLLDYGDGDQANGEVFDITALLQELRVKCDYSADLRIKIETHQSYSEGRPWIDTISFGGYLSASGQDSKWVHDATHLDDVVNGLVPDTDATIAMKKRQRRLRKKADELDNDIAVQRLMEASRIRHSNPIARFTEPLPALPEAPK